MTIPDFAEAPEQPDAGFRARHIGPRGDDIALMLKAIGFDSVEALIEAALPSGIRDEQLELPPALSEPEVLADLRRLAQANRPRTSMIGMGYYDTVTPSVIVRNLLENPAWYTAYTPYQPEISQGRLQALLMFQTMVADLTGLPVANASLLDEPTAAAEAMSLARRTVRSDNTRFLVDVDTHPQTLAVLETRAEPVGIEIVMFDPRAQEQFPDAFGALLSYPGSSGRLWDPALVIARLKEAGAVVCVTSDLLALTQISAPGSMGADVVVGSAQRFGVPMGFGGPHAGFLAVRAGLERSLPGRLPAVRPTGLPFRPGNSTFGVSGRPATSAPRRSCWPSRPRCTPPITVRRACGRSHPGSTRRPADWPRP